MVIARLRGMGGSGGGYEGINGDGWRLGVVNTQYSVQVMCCKIVHLKPV